MERNVPPDSTLFLPGRVPVGRAEGGGMKGTKTAEHLALMPQFLEPLGLRFVDDIDEAEDGQR
ncbi:hypothetical protein [Streptomyces sp. NPDC048272]|uniref:hypothetical protein n=1 Tax=Streptomyces sp. NPDC048272 TaxID=3154616 RepID=UPI003432914A